MNYSSAAILAASLALTSFPILASRIEGTDLEGAARLTMNECLHLQAAKNDGATRAEMKKACQWTSEETIAATHGFTMSEKPLPVDSILYGNVPNTQIPPP